MTRRVWVVEWRRHGGEWVAEDLFRSRIEARSAIGRARCEDQHMPPGFRLKWRVVEYVPKGGES